MGLCSFWNGAAVIACLLILMGFAFFSDGKLDYLILAIVTVLRIQSKCLYEMFMSPSVYFRFLAEKKSSGIAVYLFEISGITFSLAFSTAVFFLKKMERAVAVVYFSQQSLHLWRLLHQI